MGGYPYHPISIERDAETGAMRCTVTVSLFEEYMRMIDRGIAEQGEAAMDAALEAHGYTKERIVRCRDCRYMHRVRNWLGMDVEECWLHADSESGELGKNRTEPDGFCAWGERKAVE